MNSESYTGKGTFVYKVLFSTILCCLYALPRQLENIFDKESVSVWAQALFMQAIPYLVVGFVMNNSLPKLSILLCSYPATLTEELIKVNEEE